MTELIEVHKHDMYVHIMYILYVRVPLNVALSSIHRSERTNLHYIQYVHTYAPLRVYLRTTYVCV